MINGLDYITNDIEIAIKINLDFVSIRDYYEF